MNKILIILLTAVVLSGCSSGQVETTVTRLSAVDFFNGINNSQAPIVLDVRSAGEFQNGHLEHAINLDWDGRDFNDQISALDKNSPVFVYCLSGSRSRRAANKLRREGFSQVFEMPGGMMEWRNERLPEVTTTERSVSGMTIQQYESLLESDKLVLVDFYADWCGPCKRMEPFLERIAEEMKESVVLVRIDVDEHPDLSTHMGISSIPLLKLYRNKDLVWNQVGFIGETALRAQLNKLQ